MNAGYTGCQPRPEQVRGTPDHTQRKVKASAPELAQTHCRYVPPYAALATQTIPAVYARPGTQSPAMQHGQRSNAAVVMQYGQRPSTAAAAAPHQTSGAGSPSYPTQFSPRPSTAADATPCSRPAEQRQSVPRLNVAAVDSRDSHAGKGPCLLAHQHTARPDLGAGMHSSQHAEDRSLGGAASPGKSTRSNGLYTGQAGLQPMNMQTCHTSNPNQAASYHTSGAATWRGPYVRPINIGTSRYFLLRIQACMPCVLQLPDLSTICTKQTCICLLPDLKHTRQLCWRSELG